MKLEFDDSLKEYVPVRNGNFLVIVEDHYEVDDNVVCEKVESQPFQFGSLILAHSKKLLSDVIIF